MFGITIMRRKNYVAQVNDLETEILKLHRECYALIDIASRNGVNWNQLRPATRA